MSAAKRRVKTAPCGQREYMKRLRDARKHIELAEIANSEPHAESKNAAVACAVLAGIAASDAACCKALQVSSRGDDHVEAVELLRKIRPGGESAARDLARLVALKTPSQYGFDDVAVSDAKAAIRRALSLIAFAEALAEV